MHELNKQGGDAAASLWGVDAEQLTPGHHAAANGRVSFLRELRKIGAVMYMCSITRGRSL